MAERIVETAMYSKMAKAHPSLERGMVRCRTCGRSERVDPEGGIGATGNGAEG